MERMFYILPGVKYVAYVTLRNVNVWAGTNMHPQARRQAHAGGLIYEHLYNGWLLARSRRGKFSIPRLCNMQEALRWQGNAYSLSTMMHVTRLATSVMRRVTARVCACSKFCKRYVHVSTAGHALSSSRARTWLSCMLVNMHVMHSRTTHTTRGKDTTRLSTLSTHNVGLSTMSTHRQMMREGARGIATPSVHTHTQPTRCKHEQLRTAAHVYAARHITHAGGTTMSAMSTSRWMTVRATRGTYRIMHTHTHLGKYGPNMLRRVIAHPVHMLERYVRSLAIARSQANLDRGHDMLYLHRGKWTIVDHVERRLWWLQSTLEDIAMYITWDTPEPDIPRFTAGIVRRVPVTTHCEQFAEWNADTEFVHGSFLYPENASGLCECEVCVYVRKVNYLKRHGVAR